MSLLSSLPALRHRDFAIFWGASTLSRIGTQMRDLALAWHLYALTGSPLALGLVGAAKVIPIVAFGLVGGALADALDRRRVMLVTQSVLAVSSLALAALTAAGLASPALLYAGVALGAAATAFDNPARQSLVVNLLPPEDLSNGLTLGILGWQVATVTGPAVGGVLLAVVPVEALYAIDAASFLAVLAALSVVRPRPSPAPPGESGPRRQPVLVALREGFAFFRRTRVLLWLGALDFFATLFAGSLLLLPIFAAEIFEAGARGLGLLASAPAVGALVASAFLSTRPPIERQGFAVLVAIGCYGACIAAFGLSGSIWVAALLLAGSGAADAVSTVVRQVARHQMTPDHLRGRTSAITMLFFMTGPQLGEVEAGLVAKLFGARASVVSGGLLCVALAVVVALAAPGLRRLRTGAAAAGSEGSEKSAPGC